MAVIADAAIEIVFLPKATMVATSGIDRSRGELLPALDDVAQPETVCRFHNAVNVVGHDHPRQQTITRSVKIQQRLFNQFGCPSCAQQACSMAGIQHLSNASSERRRIVLEIVVEPLKHVGRQTVGKTKGYRLDHPGRVKMWQIPARMPSFVDHWPRERPLPSGQTGRAAECPLGSGRSPPYPATLSTRATSTCRSRWSARRSRVFSTCAS